MQVASTCRVLKTHLQTPGMPMTDPLRRGLVLRWEMARHPRDIELLLHTAVRFQGLEKTKTRAIR